MENPRKILRTKQPTFKNNSEMASEVECEEQLSRMDLNLKNLSNFNEQTEKATLSGLGGKKNQEDSIPTLSKL